jgi:hypothetical protein
MRGTLWTVCQLCPSLTSTNCAFFFFLVGLDLNLDFAFANQVLTKHQRYHLATSPVHFVLVVLEMRSL